MESELPMTVVESRLRSLDWKLMKRELYSVLMMSLKKEAWKRLSCFARTVIHFWNPIWKVKVTDIYAKLEELGIGEKNLESGKAFLPLSGSWEKRDLCISRAIREGKSGIGKRSTVLWSWGCAPVKEPEIAKHSGICTCRREKSI